MSLLSVWTDEDTSEAGPSCDEQEVLHVTVDDDRDNLADTDVPILVHVGADGPNGLWTVALYLKTDEALSLAEQLTTLAEATR